ncbi:MAG: hypothetical protein RI907_1050 [Pseudomonadota bacterium]|jgi:hypothetical protein
MTPPPYPPRSRWLFADSELGWARLEGPHLLIQLSAAHVVLPGEEGRDVSGHLSGLTLVCEHVRPAPGEAWPDWREVLGRVSEGRWQGAGDWQRHWPLDAPVQVGPLRLQWHLANHTELTLHGQTLYLDGLERARFHASLAC